MENKKSFNYVIDYNASMQMLSLLEKNINDVKKELRLDRWGRRIDFSQHHFATKMLDLFYGLLIKEFDIQDYEDISAFHDALEKWMKVYWLIESTFKELTIKYGMMSFVFEGVKEIYVKFYPHLNSDDLNFKYVWNKTKPSSVKRPRIKPATYKLGEIPVRY